MNCDCAIKDLVVCTLIASIPVTKKLIATVFFLYIYKRSVLCIKNTFILFFCCCFMVAQKQKKIVKLIPFNIQHKSVFSYTSLCVVVIISPIQMLVLQKAGESSRFHKGHVPTKFIYFENTFLFFITLLFIFAHGSIPTRRNSF